MNYTECKKANDLIKKLQDIDFLIKKVEEEKYVSMHCSSFNVILLDGQKDKALELLKETKDNMVEELNKLGVVEDK